jgi:hypothetical protein
LTWEMGSDPDILTILVDQATEALAVLHGSAPAIIALSSKMHCPAASPSSGEGWGRLAVSL